MAEHGDVNGDAVEGPSSGARRDEAGRFGRRVPCVHDSDAEDPEWLLQVADLALVTGRCDKAVALTRHVLARLPDHPEALWILGASLRELGRYDECIEALRSAVSNVSAFRGELALLLVDAYTATGDDEKAASWLAFACQDMERSSVGDALGGFLDEETAHDKDGVDDPDARRMNEGNDYPP